LESYLIACRSILSESDEVNEDKLDIVGDNYTKQVVRKIVMIERCVERAEFNVSALIVDDLRERFVGSFLNSFRKLSNVFTRTPSHANCPTVSAQISSYRLSKPTSETSKNNSPL
jgi:hypothetical protein